MDELRRRTFLALLGTPFIAALLEACGDDVSAADTGSTRSDAVRVAATATEASAAATALNNFGISLYRQLAAADATSNIVMSPASIAVALTMTAAGARGTTLDEMTATLHVADPDHHPSLDERVDRSPRRAQPRRCAGVDRELVVGSARPDVRRSTSSTCSPPSTAPACTWSTTPAIPSRARLAINQWVSDETRERIPALIPKDVITTETRLMLVNAIYLKAGWARHFDAGLTVDAPFTTAAGDVIDVADDVTDRRVRLCHRRRVASGRAALRRQLAGDVDLRARGRLPALVRRDLPDHRRDPLPGTAPGASAAAAVRHRVVVLAGRSAA